MASSKKPSIAWGDDAGKGLQWILKKAIGKGSAKKVTQAHRVVGKTAERVTASAGKRKGTKMENALNKAIDEAMGKRISLRQADEAIARKAANAKIIKAQGRTVGAAQLGEAVGRKGTKLSKGKEVALGKEKAAKAVATGKMATSQRAKGNVARAAEQNDLRARIKAAKTAAERYALRTKLKNHEAKHGRFK